MDKHVLALSMALALCGGTATASPRPDRIIGTDVPETLRGEAGDDVIAGNAGHDEIYGGGGDDIVRAGRGRDAVSGGAGDDTIFGDEGNDTLNGGASDDLFSGGEGGDVLSGDAGDDHLNGDDGDDYLRGGEGVDWFTGGEGADRYIFAASDAVLGAPDMIADFKRDDGDRIVLSEIEGDTAFRVVTAFSNNPMELMIVVGRQSVLRYDIDGDGVADGEIVVTFADVAPGDIEL